MEIQKYKHLDFSNMKITELYEYTNLKGGIYCCAILYFMLMLYSMLILKLFGKGKNLQGEASSICLPYNKTNNTRKRFSLKWYQDYAINAFCATLPNLAQILSLSLGMTLRHILFVVRAGNSIMAKICSVKFTMQCTNMKFTSTILNMCEVEKIVKLLYYK